MQRKAMGRLSPYVQQKDVCRRREERREVVCKTIMQKEMKMRGDRDYKGQRMTDDRGRELLTQRLSN